LKRSIARLVPHALRRHADPLHGHDDGPRFGELALFGALGQDGPLVDVLYASCALPLYFPPQTIDGRRLGEGGLRAVLGLDAARRVPADLVVAVDVGPGFDEPPATKQAGIPPLVRAHGEAIRVMMAAQTERAIAAWPKDAPRLVVVRAWPSGSDIRGGRRRALPRRGVPENPGGARLGRPVARERAPHCPRQHAQQGRLHRGFAAAIPHARAMIAMPSAVSAAGNSKEFLNTSNAR